MKKKPTHGGKRDGAGRPKLPKAKLKEKTKVMRVPVSKVPMVETLITNEGETIGVDGSLINDLRKLFEAGDWATLIKVNDRPYMIILPDNFR